MLRFNRINLERQSEIGLAVIALLTLFLCFLFGYSIETHRIQNRELKESREIIDKVSQISLLLKDAETAQRGYFLTKKANYLLPYNNALKNLPRAKNELTQLISTKHKSYRQIKIINQLSDLKITELTTTINLKKEGKEQEALKIITSDKGNNLMNQIREVANQIDSIERQKVKKLLIQRDERDKRDWILLLISISLGTLQIGLFYYLIRRGLSKIRTVQEDLKENNIILRSVSEELGEKNIQLAENNQTLIRLSDDLNQKNIELEEERDTIRRFNEIQSTMIRTGSHELRTPLTTMMTAVELLEVYRDRWTEEKKIRYFEQLKKNINYMNQIIEDMLSLNRIESNEAEIVNKELLNLNQICKELIELFNDNPNLNRNFLFESNEKTLWLTLNENLVRQALINLLSNAIKYSSDGSTIWIETKKNANKTVTLVIRDEGIGIPPESMDKLFAPFYRCENVGNIKGTGIGLSIVQQGIEKQGGIIKVESKVGVGTTFTISFPID